MLSNKTDLQGTSWIQWSQKKLILFLEQIMAKFPDVENIDFTDPEYPELPNRLRFEITIPFNATDDNPLFREILVSFHF